MDTTPGLSGVSLALPVTPVELDGEVNLTMSPVRIPRACPSASLISIQFSGWVIISQGLTAVRDWV